MENILRGVSRVQVYLDNLRLVKVRVVQFLGHKIDCQGVHPDGNKMDAIRNAPCPNDVVQLKSFLGLINYYQRFIPMSSSILASLYNLTKNKIPWNWSDECRSAFENIKQYEIQHRKGVDISNADALSRLPQSSNTGENACSILLLENLPLTYKEVSKKTCTDEVLKEISQYTKEGWPGVKSLKSECHQYYKRREELSLVNDCLILGNRVVIPKSLREDVLMLLHKNHPGIVRSKMLARSYVWWPNIDIDIDMFIKTCTECQCNQNDKNVSEKVYIPWENPSDSWKRIHIDFLEINQVKLLIIVDSFSKWIECFAMGSTTASKVIKVLENCFCRFGSPEIMVTDNGPPFGANEFKAYCEKNCIKLVHSPPYNPESNGITIVNGLVALSSCADQYNITQFNNPPMYYHAMGNLCITDSCWNLLTYVNLKNYDEQTRMIDEGIKHVTQECKKLYETATACEQFVFNQFKLSTSHLMQSQTTIIRNMVNDINETMQRVAKQAEVVDELITHERVENLVDIVNYDTLGHIHSSIMSPKTITQQINDIKSKLPPNSEFLLETSTNSISDFFKIATVTVISVDDILIFSIEIPITNGTRFIIYEVIPLPMQLTQDQVIIIEAKSTYLAVDKTQKNFISFEEHQLTKCIVLKDAFVCPNEHHIDVNDQLQDCDQNLFNSPPSIPSSCNKKILLSKPTVWHRLAGENTWLFVVQNEAITIPCENEIQPIRVTLNNIGKISINP
ncbi:hypothetical protein QTP88_001784 [Uroleucon formosanum]